MEGKCIKCTSAHYGGVIIHTRWNNLKRDVVTSHMSGRAMAWDRQSTADNGKPRGDDPRTHQMLRTSVEKFGDSHVLASSNKRECLAS